ncbi:3'-5' exonuclease [Thermoleptolyngbya sichuanensis XZ-Cy5]|uniref:3'-5' exonuclease n=1 Tax=Thermoleptolyngbya sichuanensis TaxID=2885951 RepID=UPI00240E99BA|nr:3'-5' exonuclease [Thermoleptolyngbya sichuanensis]MDG2617655.1 3'-5' exonuclease [Thermoleptolyngbya sichuanensis XZ-Cy5]
MLSPQLLQHYRQLSQQPLTVVDVETTGGLAFKHRMTELSVLHVSLKEGVQRQQSTLLNPEALIPAKIVRITGITPEMVATAPTAAEALTDFLPLLQTGVLTAHNLEFDYGFLQAEYRRLGVEFMRPERMQLCTVELSRLMLPDLPSRSLPKLVQHFQFPIDTSHRAAADTLACWLLAERLLTELCNEEDTVLLARFARQVMPLKYAAQLLGQRQKKAAKLLMSLGIEGKLVARGRSSTLLYRRGDVERAVGELAQAAALEAANPAQLSLLGE